MKTAVIDVGGGIRGVFGAGVLDRCIELDINFDECIGVSAGSANIISYIARQRGRNYLFYHEYPFRKEYMSFSNVIKNGSYLGLDYIYSELSNAGCENPLDYDAVIKSKKNFYAVGTCADTGESEYFTKSDLIRNDYAVLKASCCIPIVCKPQNVGEKYYFDGGISDPVPIEFALNLGCDKIVLILTRPEDADVSFNMENVSSRLLKNKYPALCEKLLERGKKYNDGISLAKKLRDEGRLLIVAPNNTHGMNTLTKDKSAINDMYFDGYNSAQEIKRFLDCGG